jgi:hypothetical protein
MDRHAQHVNAAEYFSVRKSDKHQKVKTNTENIFINVGENEYCDFLG